jgi:hypothetical protein
MQTLYQHLLDTPVTAWCLQDVDILDNYLELVTGFFGLTVIPDQDANGVIPGKFSAATFCESEGERVFGNMTNILDYYHYTDLTPEKVVDLFVQLTKLS